MLSFESSPPESKLFFLGALAGAAKAAAVKAGAAKAGAARAGAAKAGAARAGAAKVTKSLGAGAAKVTKSLGGITISPSNQKTENNSNTIINE